MGYPKLQGVVVYLDKDRYVDFRTDVRKPDSFLVEYVDGSRGRAMGSAYLPKTHAKVLTDDLMASYPGAQSFIRSLSGGGVFAKNFTDIPLRSYVGCDRSKGASA